MFIIPFSLPSCSSSSPPHFNTLYLYPSNCSSQNLVPSLISLVVQVALVVKNLPDNAEDVRDAGLISCSGKSPGRGYGNPLQYSGLELKKYWEGTIQFMEFSRPEYWIEARSPASQAYCLPAEPPGKPGIQSIGLHTREAWDTVHRVAESDTTKAT